MRATKLSLALLALISSLTEATLLAHDAGAEVGVSTDFNAHDSSPVDVNKAILVDKRAAYEQFSQTTKNNENGAKTRRATSNDDENSESSRNTKSDSATYDSAPAKELGVLHLTFIFAVTSAILWGVVNIIDYHPYYMILVIPLLSCAACMYVSAIFGPDIFNAVNIRWCIIVMSGYTVFVKTCLVLFGPKEQPLTGTRTIEYMLTGKCQSQPTDLEATPGAESDIKSKYL